MGPPKIGGLRPGIKRSGERSIKVYLPQGLGEVVIHAGLFRAGAVAG